MKVIFIKDLKKQGKVNEIKEVSDGYAINYLIKNGYAVKYTKGSASILDKELKIKKEQVEEARSNALKLKEELEKITLKFVVKCNNGKVFGSISSKQIHEELLKLGYKVDKKIIKIDGTISSLGVHLVSLNLYKGVICNLKIQLVEK